MSRTPKGWSKRGHWILNVIYVSPMAALSRQLVVRRWLIFAIYYAAIYCGHNSMATKWRAKVFDSTKDKGGPEIPARSYPPFPRPRACLPVRISVVLLDFGGRRRMEEDGGREGGCPWRREMIGAIDVRNGIVGWNVNEIVDRCRQVLLIFAR